MPRHATNRRGVKVALLSDVHANLVALEAATDSLRAAIHQGGIAL